MAGFKDATAIVGIGRTPFAERLPETERALACRAILAALDDAGIAPDEVDALASYTMDPPAAVQGTVRACWAAREAARAHALAYAPHLVSLGNLPGERQAELFTERRPGGYRVR